MKILNIFKNREVEALKTQLGETNLLLAETARKLEKRKEPQASSNVMFSLSFDGEKNLGEIGPIKDYILNHEALRMRSWQSYLESEITQTVLNKFTTWVIGNGLKLQAEPAKVVLASEKINLKSEDFNEVAEARFSVYADSRIADYAGMKSLHKLAWRTFINAKIAGDCLVVLRYINNQVKVQIVDSAHVGSPTFNSDYIKQATASGNTIRHGIELSPTGEHVAYFVKKGPLQYERIEARGKKSGLTQAFMVYGMEYRLDNVRGLPLIAAMLETLKKLERYKEAVVGSAEERQKIAYSIVHEIFSNGENPLMGNMAKMLNADAEDDVPTDVNGKELANTIAATTNKQVFNMPKGAKLESLESKNELYFKDFYAVNINLVCAAMGIPPEVALSKYDSNFSASRAALKDWEHTINVNRKDFSFQFYQQVYNFWLETEILKNKIPAPGYLTAKSNDDALVLEAYRKSRWVGSTVPHIDPLKEVNAERAKLGELAKNIPLTTIEAATENLNGGESDSNMEQFAAEYNEAMRLIPDIKMKPKEPSVTK